MEKRKSSRKYKIAVLVLHFGDVSPTFTCLKSLSKIKSKHTLDFYLIDNGSSNLTENEVKHIIPKAKLIHNSSNLGYAAGLNPTLKKAVQEGADAILLLNNDVTVKSTVVDELYSLLIHSSIGICGPVITYSKEPNKIWFAGGLYNKYFCYSRHPSMNTDFKKERKSRPVDFITGAVIMIRKEVFQNIGYLNENYFLYWEDVDFCLRARRAGFRSYVTNKILAFHNVSSSSGIQGKNILTPLRAYYYARNPFVFLKDNNNIGLVQIIGQFLIRFPYYIIQTENINAKSSYIKGLFNGIKYLFYKKNKKIKS